MFHHDLPIGILPTSVASLKTSNGGQNVRQHTQMSGDMSRHRVSPECPNVETHVGKYMQGPSHVAGIVRPLPDLGNFILSVAKAVRQEQRASCCPGSCGALCVRWNSARPSACVTPVLTFAERCPCTCAYDILLSMCWREESTYCTEELH